MNFFLNIRIARKLLGVFASICLVLVLGGAITIYEIRSAGDAVEDTRQAAKLQHDLGILDAAGNNQLLAIRGLLMTGDRNHIDAYEKSAKRFDATLARMAEKASSDEVVRHVEALRAITDTWRSDVVGPQIEAMNHPLTVDAARTMEANGLGDDYLAAHSKEIAALAEIASARAEKAENTAREAFSITVIVAIIGSTLAILIAAVSYLALVGAISRPIARMTEVMGILAEGRHDVEVPSVGRGDEVGAMAEAVEVFKRNGIEREAALAREEEARRKEKEALAARERRTQRMEELIANFDSRSADLVSALETSAHSLEETAQVMGSSADETDKQATAVAAASEEASTNVQTVAAAAEELRSSIAEIAKQVSGASEIAGEAATTAEQAQSRVAKLEEAANAIGEVVSMINDIADQTNLLALNATIEAARAGEAGKGFAVVAEEVKSLASQTSGATEKIREQIEAMQTETAQSVDAIEGIAAIIARVNEYTYSISSAVEQQSAATDEIAMNVSQASSATGEVASNIQSVHQASTESGRIAGTLKTASDDIGDRARAMKAGVEGFVREIRAL
ncbi:HAMP domain-containing protein [Marivibrio halodurans]|uniref:HAMP domain-containing protein n=1 Tax=Marivibrio halodurans TaxID=2039722 RepID=A0A8J7SQ46_9PROT|nr:methyl-accepting chemotaxis protein [Marivibrio halodurans]MBP5858801.1 HAMP domain-containing protein [Marivibrio halodurans]